MDACSYRHELKPTFYNLLFDLSQSKLFYWSPLTLQDDRDNFLSLALEGYKRCLVIGDKYDVRVVCTYSPRSSV
jgi:hypothetical protein